MENKKIKKGFLEVNFVTLKKPFDNKIDINILVQYFGYDIPKYLQLDRSDKYADYYICCIKPEVDVREICYYMGYICYNIHESVVDTTLFKRSSKIVVTDDNEFYRLERRDI